MTFRHTFAPCPAPDPRRTSSETDDLRDARAEARDALRSTLDGGLAFYWTLARAASDVGRGRRARLTYGHSETAAGDDRLPEWSRHRTDPTPRVPVSLEVDASGRTRNGPGADDSPNLEDFVGWATPFICAEQARRAIRHARAASRELETQAAHDLRALLQPLMLHVDQLKRTGPPSPGEFELLDDLTRAFVAWIEEELESGRLGDRVRNATESGEASAGAREALDQAREEETPRGLEVSVADRLPDVSLDRPRLVAGLRELVRLGREDARRLRMEGDGNSVSIRLSFSEEPCVAGSPAPGGDDREYPPVSGGLLDLTASTGGTIRVTRGADLHGQVVVALPTGPRRTSRGLSG